MNTKKFSEAMSEIDNKYVEEALSYKKKAKKPGWIKWGAIAACFCLLVGGAFMYRHLNVPITPGGGIGEDPGGSFPESVDPIISSLAVFPASEKIQDVENATLESLDEAVAYAMVNLGAYLPNELPDGYAFSNANLYETTMKSGTKYYMLRVTYDTETGTFSAPVAEGEEEIPATKATGSSLVVFVMNYQPKTEKKIYESADISESVLERIMQNGTFHISYGDVYVGISPNSKLTATEMLTIIQSINK